MFSSRKIHTARAAIAVLGLTAGTELDETREIWVRLVALLESTACPRLAEAALRTIAGGGSVTFGGRPASRIDADALLSILPGSERS